MLYLIDVLTLSSIETDVVPLEPLVRLTPPSLATPLEPSVGSKGYTSRVPALLTVVLIVLLLVMGVLACPI